jgi:hypothetical protein
MLGEIITTLNKAFVDWLSNIVEAMPKIIIGSLIILASFWGAALIIA